MGAQISGWSPTERAKRARTKLKRAARAYVEACDHLQRLGGPGTTHLVVPAEEEVLATWRRLVHAAALLTRALEGGPARD
jgi:hypothetical protein